MKRKDLLVDFLEFIEKERLKGTEKATLVDKFIESKGIELMDLMTLLEILPGKLRNKQEEIDAKIDEKGVSDYNKKGIEMHVYSEVSSETITVEGAMDGEELKTKKKYSSIAAIDREVKKRLDNSSSYKDRLRELVDVSKEIKDLERNLEFLKNTHRSAIAKTRLLGVE